MSTGTPCKRRNVVHNASFPTRGDGVHASSPITSPISSASSSPPSRPFRSPHALSSPSVTTSPPQQQQHTPPATATTTPLSKSSTSAAMPITPPPLTRLNPAGTYRNHLHRHKLPHRAVAPPSTAGGDDGGGEERRFPLSPLSEDEALRRALDAPDLIPDDIFFMNFDCTTTLSPKNNKSKLS